MKKVLLATTVLALSATVAAADVAVTGEARMGLIYDGNTAAGASKTLFTSRVRVTFTGSGETDGGLTFGFKVRNDQSGQGNTSNGDSTVFISGAFGKLTFGDNDTAANVLVGHVDAISLTGLGDTNELGYVGQADTSVLYEYATGPLSFALSLGQRDRIPGVLEESETISVAAKYSADTFYVALGHEEANAVDQTSLALGGSFSGVDVKFVAMDNSANVDTHFAVSVGYGMDALAVAAFYADRGADAGDSYGIGASYDLGGGAAVKGGVAKTKGSKAVADLGLNFKF